ncbi:MAG: putative Fe-S cluster assembly protein SufT [Gammaproteobacteria bacterium]|nr:putative Fe-S cluster assembly protein SufT [Gammaproteobacteria bacterium]
MSNPETIKLTRDCIAIQVPFGNQITLPKNTEVTITQELGGTYTVIANNNMFRIDSSNADALNKLVATENTANNANVPLEEQIWAQLRTCYDPEIPVNIVDLGLVYGVDITPAEENKFNVVIRMTLTAPACGMGPIIAADAKQKVSQLPQVKEATIEMVFDPPWDRSRMSDQAKLTLGLM